MSGRSAEGAGTVYRLVPSMAERTAAAPPTTVSRPYRALTRAADHAALDGVVSVASVGIVTTSSAASVVAAFWNAPAAAKNAGNVLIYVQDMTKEMINDRA